MTSAADSPDTQDTATFDICAPIPGGTTLLEASAGTGKTFTIAALASRYVAEGLASLDQLLLITFGRMATRELRERVRDRLLFTQRELADPAAARAGSDPVIAMLADAADAEVALRLRRIDHALSTFDAATIATTHGFCSQSLAALGLVADVDPRETFTEDLSDLVAEVVDDLYVRKYGPADAPEPSLRPKDAYEIANLVVDDAQAVLTPAGPGESEEATTRWRFAQSVRDEVERRRRSQGLVTYNDLVTRLAHALEDPVTGEDACRRLRGRYRVVMVDEFQDTDADQWRILERAFHGHCDLVLIGDPKQAIYNFRGGDVFMYLTAKELADQAATLHQNWRSDQPLVDAVGGLFTHVALGHPHIVAPAVTPVHTGSRLHGADCNEPLRLRFLEHVAGQSLAVGRVRAAVARDAANDIVRLLRSGAELTLDDSVQRVQPGHIAVLVPGGRQESEIHAALLAAGVPAVVTGLSSVYATAAALDWLRLLRALEQPQNTTRVHDAMLSSFIGATGAELAHDDGARSDQVAGQLREWAAALTTGGVTRLNELIESETGMLGRVLQQPDGERLLTDIRQIGEDLHGLHRGGTGTAGLAEWLANRIHDSGGVVEAASRRLDSDAEAVQIITVHRSKGSEFPIVYVPFAWDRHVPSPDSLRYHQDDRRLLDVRGSTASDWATHKAAHRDEEAGEVLRLLYVALTRARCQVVTWWAPSNNTKPSELHRLLSARLAGDREPKANYQLTAVTPRSVRDRLGLPVELVPDEPDQLHWTPPEPAVAGLKAAPYSRHVDTAWRRTSYSGLTRVVHEAIYSQSGEPFERDDEPAGSAAEPQDEDVASPSVPVGGALSSPMAHLPTGTTFGTVVHRVYETLDTAAVDLPGELHRCCREALVHRPLSDLGAGQLAAGMLPSLLTPLGTLGDDRRLCDIAPGDRLTELEFEFPLAGGDTPGPPVVVADLSATLRDHLPEADPLAGYPALLQQRGLSEQRLTGFLSGSIDAVLRLNGPSGHRFVVVDYKTNWLGGSIASGELTAADYGSDAMAEAMMHAHYPLQALLYSVALHRYLRWRVPGYDPDVHLGGVLYLFVRGMCGPDTPLTDGHPNGVFGWRPAGALVSNLSDLIAGGGR